MFKGFALISCSILLSCVSYAGNNAPYVGASLGVASHTSSSNNPVVDSRSAPISVFAGYGATFQNSMYVAGEVNLTPASSSIQNNGLKTSYSYGASVLPGVFVTDHTLVFARLGVNRTRFSSQDQTTTGWVMGLGSQFNVSQNLDVRGEYNFVAHNDVKNVKSPRSDAFNLGLVYLIN